MVRVPTTFFSEDRLSFPYKPFPQAQAAKQSSKKKAVPLLLWLRADYVNTKWLSPCNRIINNPFNGIRIKVNPISDLILVGDFEEEVQLEEGVKPEPLMEVKPKVEWSRGGKVSSGLAPLASVI